MDLILEQQRKVRISSKLVIKFINYYKRVIADSGVINNNDVVNNFYKLSIPEAYFAWFAEAGYKATTSGIYKNFDKLYNLFGSNDAAQGTVLKKPYIAGNIAPNEKIAILNPNNDGRYMTHPSISFLSTDGWSLTVVINSNRNSVTGYSFIAGDVSSFDKSKIGFGLSNNNIRLFNSVGTAYNFAGNLNSLYGKTAILTFLAVGDGTLKLYVNGVFNESQPIVTSFIFSVFVKAYSIENTHVFMGRYYAHMIHPVLTESQIGLLHTFLRKEYPDVETVQIGTKKWTTSNLDIAITSRGTAIPDGNLTASWITGTSFWCYHTDIATGAIYGKLYNKAAKLAIVADPPSGYHVSTEAELTNLALSGGYALKKEGTSYWNTANGTNSTGFTALGGSSRNADGSFNTIKDTSTFWCADSDKILLLNHADNTATIVASAANNGHSIRLVSNLTFPIILA